MARFSQLFLLITLLCVPFCAQTPATTTYPNSAEGFRQQLEDLIALRKSGNEAEFRAAVSAFAIPSASDWIAARFLPSDISRLQRDYPLSLEGFQRHLSWVAENAVHLPGWNITAKPSELPGPPAPVGKESVVPVPTENVSVENFRYGPAAPEDKIERSWVNSFLYIDGRFRYAGGTYPFWSEELQNLRATPAGTMESGLLPGNVTAARLIHKVAPEYPKKARKKQVEGVVRLHAIIGKDGTIHELTVLYGDPLLTDAALKAVRQWRYSPTLVNGEPVEVDTTIDVNFALNR